MHLYRYLVYDGLDYRIMSQDCSWNSSYSSGYNKVL